MTVRLHLPLAALGSFAAVLGLVVAGWPPLVEWDAELSAQARRAGTEQPDWVATLRVLTDAASTVAFLSASAALTVVLLALRRYRAGVATAIVGGTVPVAWGVLHAVLHRPRPVDGFVLVTTNGFPSGHTAHATAAGLLAVLLLWAHVPRWGRVVAVLLAAAVVGFIGYSRIALLAHWPSDVLGGVLLSLGIVPLAVRLSRLAGPAGGPAGPAGGPAASARSGGGPG